MYITPSDQILISNTVDLDGFPSIGLNLNGNYSAIFMHGKIDLGDTTCYIQKLPTTTGISIDGAISGSIQHLIFGDSITDGRTIIARTSGSQPMEEILNVFQLDDTTVWTLSASGTTIVATKNYPVISNVTIAWVSQTRAVVSVTLSDKNRATSIKAAFAEVGGSHSKEATVSTPYYAAGATHTIDVTDIPLDSGNNITWNITISAYNSDVGSDAGTFVLNNQTCSISPIYVTSYPLPAFYAIGDTAESLSVTASASETISYQWQSSSDNSTYTDMPGYTASTLSFPSNYTSAERVTYYRVVLTAGGDNLTTPGVKVQVYDNTIVYNLNGGSLPSGAPTTYTTGQDTKLLDPEKDGYTGRWVTSQGGSTVVTKIPAGTTGKQVLYADYSAQKYLITYDANGGTVKGMSTSVSSSSYSVQVTYGDAYPTVYSVTRTGYDLVGWYYGETKVTLGTTKMSDSSIDLSEAHTLTAIWSKGGITIWPDPVTVELDLDGGSTTADMTGWTQSGSIYTIEVPYNTVFHFPEFISGSVTKYGYNWGSSSYYWQDASSAKVSTMVPRTVSCITSDMSYTALYSAAQFTITIDLDGGAYSSSQITAMKSAGWVQGTAPDTDTFTYTGTYGSTLNLSTINGYVPTKTGKAFGDEGIRWTAGSKAVSALPSSLTIEGDVTYTAQWSDLLLKVTIDLNGGETGLEMTGWTKSGTTYYKQIVYNDSVTFPSFVAGSVTRANYTWGSSGNYWTDGTTPVAAYAIPTIEHVLVDVTYTAQYTQNTHTLSGLGDKSSKGILYAVINDTPVTADQTIGAGDTVTIKSVPASEYKLRSLTYAANAVETPINLAKGVDYDGYTLFAFVMPDYDTVMNAEYSKGTGNWTISVSITGSGFAKVVDKTVTEGKSTYLMCEPEDGYAVGTVSIDQGYAIKLSDTSYQIYPLADATVSVSFVEESEAYYNIDLPTVANATVTGSDRVLKGQTGYLQVIPKEGYKVSEIAMDNGTLIEVSAGMYIIIPTDDASVSITVSAMEDSEVYSTYLEISAERVQKNGKDGLRVHVRPNDGLYVVNGTVSVQYTYCTTETIDGVQVMVYDSATAGSKAITGDQKEVSEDIYVTAGNLVSIYAAYSYTDDDGTTVIYETPYLTVL